MELFLRIVAIINCFVGIVYIYMVAEVLEQKVRFFGYIIKVEI